MSKWIPAFQLACFALPWGLRRRALIAALGWEIHPSARIGRSILMVRHLRMGPRARIGHFTFARNVELLELGSGASLGNKNWISGFTLGSDLAFADSNRRAVLSIGDEAAITHGHRIDCTDSVTIGEFTTVAGWDTQFVTHAISVYDARQRCAPITVGRYCFVGTRCTLLKGTILPDYSVLGAGSVLAQKMNDTHKIYSGVPAQPVKQLSPDCKYLTRTKGPCF